MYINTHFMERKDMSGGVDKPNTTDLQGVRDREAHESGAQAVSGDHGKECGECHNEVPHELQPDSQPPTAGSTTHTSFKTDTIKMDPRIALATPLRAE